MQTYYLSQGPVNIIGPCYLCCLYVQQYRLYSKQTPGSLYFHHSVGIIKYWVYQAISVTYWQAITNYLRLRMVVIYTKVVGAWAHNICVSCNVFYYMNTRSISVQEMTMGATANYA
jgi:hypothetical protein